jgi:putative protein-disulfide isomerase
MTSTLYYAHDPMCSWCWAFRPVWDHVCGALGADIEITRLLGGLAPDSAAPMPQQMQEVLQATWQNIQSRVPGIEFNYDFWTRCKPRRSTYPACRAVIAAARQGDANDEAMTRAIQRAYYLEARNPSDDGTLIDLARATGLDHDRFSRDLNSTETREALHRHVAQCRRLNISGFPSLLVQREGIIRRVPVEYNDPGLQLRLIEEAAG